MADGDVVRAISFTIAIGRGNLIFIRAGVGITVGKAPLFIVRAGNRFDRHRRQICRILLYTARVSRNCPF